MNSFDFKFTKFDPEFSDFWFEISGESSEILTKAYSEANVLGVTGVMYSEIDDSVQVKRLLLKGTSVSGYDIITSNDANLKEILVHKVSEIKKIFRDKNETKLSVVSDYTVN